MFGHSFRDFWDMTKQNVHLPVIPRFAQELRVSYRVKGQVSIFLHYKSRHANRHVSLERIDSCAGDSMSPVLPETPGSPTHYPTISHCLPLFLFE